ncbi:transposase [Vreelandella glaciei]|uniref:transposase n=1 Tax=Vreelandella glaciei TaxID=186761 RepID=UPI0030017CCF
MAKSSWSDQALLTGVAQRVLPYMQTDTPRYWVIDDTAIRKKGRHSVGVSRQYCDEIGKQDNCQAAVSLSVATEQASLPVAWQLYLPTFWTDNPDRCRKTGVPAEVHFATKQEIALAKRLKRALSLASSWPMLPMVKKPHGENSFLNGD